MEDHYASWDPGGNDFQVVGHQLEENPDVKEGRMLRTNVVLHHGIRHSRLVEHDLAMLVSE